MTQHSPAFAWLEALRLGAGMGVNDFCWEMDISSRAYHNWKTGKSVPSRETIQNAGRAFGQEPPEKLLREAHSKGGDASGDPPGPSRRWVYLPELEGGFHCSKSHCVWTAQDGKCHAPRCLYGLWPPKHAKKRKRGK